MTSWTSRYAPWLPIEQSLSHAGNPLGALNDPGPSNHQQGPRRDGFLTSTFLQAAQWTLAARHLPTNSGSLNHLASLRSQLGRVLAQRLSQAILGLDDSLPALRALLILATWPTHFIRPLATSWTGDAPRANGQADAVYDGELLSTIAMHIASRMHLELDVETALTQKLDGPKRNHAELVGRSEVLDRARVVRHLHLPIPQSIN